MARLPISNVGYGLTNSLQTLAPIPIKAQRAPLTTDTGYEIGTTWVDMPNNAPYVLTSVAAGAATWTGQAGGSGTFTDVTVNPGDLTVTAGNATIGGTLGVTGATTLADVNIVGNLTLTGDFDITDTASIGLTSTNNAAGAITLTANGGASETILIRSLQGTGVDSLNLASTAGGITLTAGLASADAINLNATGGGVDIDGALQVNIASSQNAANAIVINASAGGIDITNTGTAGEDIDIVSTGASVNIESTEDAALAVYLHANGGTSETIRLRSDQGTGVASVDILSDVGGITLTSGLASTDAINLVSTAGGLDVNAALEINIDSSEAAVADAVRIVASAADGGIDIDAGTGGITIDSTGAFSIDGAAASNVTTTGAGIDLTLASVLGSVLISSTEDAALAIRLHANGGTSETIQLHSDQGTGVDSISLLSDVGGITLTATGVASADAINLEAIAGGVDIDGALQVNIASSQNAADAIVLSASAGGIDILATGAAGEDIDIVNTGGSVNVTATEDVARAIYIRANGGTSETIDIHADQGTAADSIELLSDVGGITLTSGLASADAINLSASAGGVDIDGALQVNIASSQNAGDAIVITSSAGGIDILATGAAAGEDIDITASSSINVTSTEDAAQSIYLHANGGTSETIQLHADQGTGVASVYILSDVGGLTLESGLDSADAINIVASAGGIDIDAVGAAGQDIVITNTGGSVSLVATEATADAIVLNASNAAGGIDLLTGGGEISISSSGNVAMVPATATEASPTATTTINARVFKATFTGFTTAAAGTQAFTISNSTLGAGDGVILTVANRGSNDAQMSLRRVNTETAGTIIVNTINNGAAALNGDVVITGWVID